MSLVKDLCILYLHLVDAVLDYGGLRGEFSLGPDLALSTPLHRLLRTGEFD